MIDQLACFVILDGAAARGPQLHTRHENLRVLSANLDRAINEPLLYPNTQWMQKKEKEKMSK